MRGWDGVALGLSFVVAFGGGAVACGLSSAGTADGGSPLDGSVDATTFDGDPLDAGSDTATDAPAPQDGGDSGCPTGLPGPPLVRATDFCIDATEVTRLQYAKFLANLGDGGVADAGGLVVPPECNWKKSTAELVPSANWDPQASPQKPVVNVDWCDARLYCRWAGKRLCGKRSGGGLGYDDPPDSPTSQWYTACSQDGLRTFAYGANWDATKCRVDDNGQKCTTVASYPQCVGGYPGLFDMTGNVGEWVDQCQGPAKNDDCRILGGDYGTNEDGSRCDARQNRGRDNSSNDWLGFRCCF